jgi:hypothetical protein
MQANNATSEIYHIPADEQRCYAIGQASDPAAARVAGGVDELEKHVHASSPVLVV